MKLFLFDLDGTLVSTGGAGLRALDQAFHKVYGIPDTVKNLNPCGKTDPAIFREMIRKYLERDMNPSDFENLSSTYLSFLQSEVNASQRKKILKGVSEFLDHLAQRKDILLALGTGNLETGARIKLAPLDLNKYFAFGGFGSDAEERSEVLQHGRRRAEKSLSRKFEDSSVYVIGDTVLDVAAARRAGFQAVAVASGAYSTEILAESNPDYLWPDMHSGFELLKSWEH